MIYFLYVLILILPPAFIYTYRQGIKDGQRINNGEQLKSITPKKQKPREITKEEIIRYNIENYDGTGKGQIKIEDV